MEDAIDGGLIVVGCLTGDVPAGVAVTVESWEVAARNLQPDAVTRQKHIRRGPQVEPEFVNNVRFQQFGRGG